MSTLRECPVCHTKQVDDSGRCTNTACSMYSTKVLDRETKKCDKCGSSGAIRRRQNTQYIEEYRNFATFCAKCQIEEDEHWAEMWSDFYSDKL